jgi:hypothetical protein
MESKIVEADELIDEIPIELLLETVVINEKEVLEHNYMTLEVS